MRDSFIAGREADETATAPTVLIVDDDNAIRSLVYSFLDERGYNVLAAANGLEALVICRQFRHPIALLLTDVEMPGMTGFELADHVRALRPEMRVLFMSGGFASSPPGWSAPPMVVPKPFNTAVLISAIKQVLRSLAQ